MKVLILAGGFGTRLNEETDLIPKPLVKIGGKPILWHIMKHYSAFGYNEFVILLGYKADVIVDRYEDMTNITIEFSYGTKENQTGRRVLNAFNQLDNHFLLMYGDNYWPIELNAMWSNYKKLGANVSTTVFSNINGTGEYGYENNVVVGNDGMVVKYDKNRETDAANGVDIGYFIVSKESLDPGLSGNVSFEVDILPQFIAKNHLGSYVTDSQYYYITNMQTLKDFENSAKANNFLALSHRYFRV